MKDQFTKQEKQTCEFCHTVLESSLFCQTCEKFQANPNKNYFSILGLPIQYKIEPTKLEEQHDKLILLLHPDLYAMSDEETKQASLQASTLLEQAYSSLSKPFSRGTYLLSLFTKDTALPAPDNVFLERQFLWHSQIESESTETILTIKNQVQTELLAIQSALSSLFPSLSSSEKNIEEIKANLAKLHFLKRINEQIQNLSL